FAPSWNRNRPAGGLGAAGAARAVVHALRQRGVGDNRIINRTISHSKKLREHLVGSDKAHGKAVPDLLEDAELLVNNTSLGMAGKNDAQVLPADPDFLPAHAIVTDIVYAPLETPLLARAGARGLKTVDGLGMLLHQAVPGFQRWFGRRPEVTPELRALVVA